MAGQMTFLPRPGPRDVRMNSQMTQMNADVRRFLLYLHFIRSHLRQSAFIRAICVSHFAPVLEPESGASSL